MEALNRSSLSMRGTSDLHKWQVSWMVLQGIPGGAPDSTVHCWRTQASATVSSHLTTWMSLGPWILVGNGGRKSPCLKPTRLGGALHQTLFSSWAVGSLKATACFLASHCTWQSLRGPVPFGEGTWIPTTNSAALLSPLCMLRPSHWGCLDWGLADAGV